MSENFNPVPLSADNTSIVNYLESAIFDEKFLELAIKTVAVSFLSNFRMVDDYSNYMLLLAYDVCDNINNGKVLTVGEIRNHYNKNVDSFLLNNNITVRNIEMLKTDGFYVYLSMLKINMRDIQKIAKQINVDEKRKKYSLNENFVNAVILILFVLSIIAIYFYFN